MIWPLFSAATALLVYGAMGFGVWNLTRELARRTDDELPDIWLTIGCWPIVLLLWAVLGVSGDE